MVSSFVFDLHIFNDESELLISLILAKVEPISLFQDRAVLGPRDIWLWISLDDGFPGKRFSNRRDDVFEFLNFGYP